MHERLNKILTLEDIDYIYKIIYIFFNVSSIDLDKLEVNEIYRVYYIIVYYIENINNDINILGKNEEVEKDYKGSIFDSFDEENGYNDIEEIKENRWSCYLESLNYIFKYAITACRNSLKDCLDNNILDLIEYIKFDIEYEEEHKEEKVD